MLSAKVLSSDATLNSFSEVATLAFIPGESVTLVIRLIQPQRVDQLRFVPADEDAELSVFIPLKDGTDQEVAATKMAGDASIWTAVLSAELTEEMAGGNFTFELYPEGGDTPVVKGWVQNGLSLVITGGDCC